MGSGSIRACASSSSRTGDLDVTLSITIQGMVALTTVINGAGLDRVFEVRPGGNLTLFDLTVQGGNVRGSLSSVVNPAASSGYLLHAQRPQRAEWHA